MSLEYEPAWEPLHILHHQVILVTVKYVCSNFVDRTLISAQRDTFLSMDYPLPGYSGSSFVVRCVVIRFCSYSCKPITFLFFFSSFFLLCFLFFLFIYFFFLFFLLLLLLLLVLLLLRFFLVFLFLFFFFSSSCITLEPYIG